MISSQSVPLLAILASSWLWHVFLWSNHSVSKSCHFHIRDIRRIRHLLPLSTATALANSLVSSKLDYCNSLYSGISQTNLNKLQRIQNSLARDKGTGLWIGTKWTGYDAEAYLFVAGITVISMLPPNSCAHWDTCVIVDYLFNVPRLRDDRFLLLMGYLWPSRFVTLLTVLTYRTLWIIIIC